MINEAGGVASGVAGGVGDEEASRAAAAKFKAFELQQKKIDEYNPLASEQRNIRHAIRIMYCVACLMVAALVPGCVCAYQFSVEFAARHRYKLDEGHVNHRHVRDILLYKYVGSILIGVAAFFLVILVVGGIDLYQHWKKVRHNTKLSQSSGAGSASRSTGHEKWSGRSHANTNASQQLEKSSPTTTPTVVITSPHFNNNNDNGDWQLEDGTSCSCCCHPLKKRSTRTTPTLSEKQVTDERERNNNTSGGASLSQLNKLHLSAANSVSKSGSFASRSSKRISFADSVSSVISQIPQVFGIFDDAPMVPCTTIQPQEHSMGNSNGTTNSSQSSSINDLSRHNGACRIEATQQNVTTA